MNYAKYEEKEQNILHEEEQNILHEEMTHKLYKKEVKKIQKSADDVKKKVKNKNTNLFKNIFRYDLLLKELKSVFSINSISILFLLLILLHVSFGYSISTKRLLLFISFITSLSILYIIYKLIFEELIETDKYPIFTKIYPVFIIILFLSIVIGLYRFILLPHFPEKYFYEFPI
jgi:hypothetical protein